MQNFSYTKSVELTQALSDIDELRKEIVLFSLSPTDEASLQWQSMLNRIHFTLALQGVATPLDQINTYLSPLGSAVPHPHADLIIGYKKAFDYLYQNWLVSKNPVTVSSLVDFYRVCFQGNLVEPEEKLETSLRYIQVNPEHPIIQAALAQILILTDNPFSDFNEQFSRLAFHLFLYKYGYDIRRLVVYEEYFYNDLVHYKDMVARSARLANVTPWLEYCATGIHASLKKTLQIISSPREQVTRKDELFELNDRQKAILNLFVQPGMKISNKLIQRKFKVSQITASRDLAKLTTLGLVFPIGKGRSTYYTKV